MKKVKFNKNDLHDVEVYLSKHKDKSIQEVFEHIKSIKVFKRSKVEHLIYTYFILHRKELKIK